MHTFLFREYGWQYTCVNIYNLFSTFWASETISSFVLIEARLSGNSDSSVDYFVDTIYFGNQEIATANGITLSYCFRNNSYCIGVVQSKTHACIYITEPDDPPTLHKIL